VEFFVISSEIKLHLNFKKEKEGSELAVKRGWKTRPLLLLLPLGMHCLQSCSATFSPTFPLALIGPPANESIRIGSQLPHVPLIPQWGTIRPFAMLASMDSFALSKSCWLIQE